MGFKRLIRKIFSPDKPQSILQTYVEEKKETIHVESDVYGEGFTEAASKAMEIARDVAIEQGSKTVEPEHLLVGLSRVPGCMALYLLSESGVGPDRFALACEGALTQGPGVGFGECILSNGAQWVVNTALKESHQLHHNYVGTEHLLLGLCKEKQSAATRVLALLGVDGSIIKKHLLEILEFDHAHMGSDTPEMRNIMGMLTQIREELRELKKSMGEKDRSSL